MTNTIPNVPRELLERLAKRADIFDDGGDGADAESARSVGSELRALLSAPSPAGVDGLEVVARQHWGDSTKLLCALGKERGIPGGYADEFTQPLCRLSDAQAIIDGMLAGNAYLQLNFDTLKADFDQQAKRIGELEEERNYLKVFQENAQLHIEGLISERDAVIKASGPVYQYGIGRGNWTDITKDVYDEYASRGGEWSVRVVYSAALSAGKDGE